MFLTDFTRALGHSGAVTPDFYKELAEALAMFPPGQDNGALLNDLFMLCATAEKPVRGGNEHRDNYLKICRLYDLLKRREIDEAQTAFFIRVEDILANMGRHFDWLS